MALKLKYLTPRQTEIAQLVAEGLSTTKIAKRLKLSTKTVEKHRAAIFQRLQVKNSVQLTRYAIRAGLVQLEGVEVVP